MTTATATREAPAATRLSAPALAVLSKVAGWLLCLLPGLLTFYFAFNSGGHGREVTALALLLLSLFLMCRIALVPQPFAGFSRPLTIAAGAMALFAGWTWISSAWSGAPIHAYTEFQRVALYTLALVFFGSFVRRKGTVAWMVRGTALAILAVCVASIATALYPDVYDVAPSLAAARLAYPISYWNGLGILAAVGTVLLLHMACDERGFWLARVLGAAGVPVTAMTIYFTFSRGSNAAIAVGVVAYLILGRPRGAIAGLIATAPMTYIAIRAGYGADLLGTVDNRTAAAAAQGHDVARTLIYCCSAAAACRLGLVPLDAALSRISIQGARAKEITALAAILVAVVVVGTAVAVDAPARLDRAWDSFTKPESGRDQAADSRKRIGDTSLGSRRDHWDVAKAYYRADRLKGAGAGTFETQWFRSRPSATSVTDAHSLYYEVLAELGLVGFLALVAAFGALLVGILAGAKAHRRPLHAAIAAASIMWMAHAGVDWDWELPAVSFWLFALAGGALATTRAGPRSPGGMAWPLRVGAGLLCLLLAIGAVRTIVATNTLDSAVTAFKDNNCVVASDYARTSLSALNTQPQAAAIIGYCDAQRGRHSDAIRAMETAARLDPDHWRYRYGLAIVRGLAGRDPRPDMARARRLDPLGKIITTGAAAQLTRSGPDDWRRVAALAERPVD